MLKLACSDQYKELLKFDQVGLSARFIAPELTTLPWFSQLKLEREAGRVFHSFHEGAITFRPTYKFQPGTNEYDQRPEKKVRAPAWCDRVLWRMKDGAQPAVRPVAYTSIDEVRRGVVLPPWRPVRTMLVWPMACLFPCPPPHSTVKATTNLL